VPNPDKPEQLEFSKLQIPIYEMKNSINKYFAKNGKKTFK
jgi:hypothetical protein